MENELLNRGKLGENAKRKVFVVDDEPDFTAFLDLALSRKGFDVVVSNDGREALHRVRDDVPDIITLDIQMPHKSGLLFYRELKSNPVYRDIPVVVITGITKNDRETEIFMRSFLEVDHLPPPNAYLEKPITDDELVHHISNVLVDR